MRHVHSARSQPQIVNPDCPKCGTPMWLARIEPDEPNYDRRTYECPECDYSITKIVKYM
jgi:transposase-like protein